MELIPVSELANAWLPLAKNELERAQLRNDIASDLQTEQIEFWLCADCGLEFAQPMKSWSDAHYPAEKHSLGYDHELALRELASMSPMRILEIGCADGQFLELAARMGHVTVGIDFSEQDIVAARKKGIEAYACDVADIRKVTSSSNTFNLIALFQVVEHLRDPDQLFSQIVEIAEPGTLLMIGCPSPRRYTRNYAHPERIGRSDFWDYPPQHLLRWTAESLTRFLKRFDFEVETVAYEPFTVPSAMAHLTGLQGINSNWYQKRWQRRFVSLQWLLRLSSDRFLGKSSGVRLYVRARHHA